MVKNETISKDYGKMAINTTTLEEVYVSNSIWYDKKCVTSSNATVTDLNIWDRNLSYDELVNWTTCR